MNPADHDDLRRLLGGYLLGGLDDADTDRLDAHLVHCDACRAELEQLGPVPEMLRSLKSSPAPAVAPGTRPSADRIEGLLGKMRAEHARERRSLRTRWLAAAAAVVLVAAVSVGFVVAGDDERPTPPPQAVPSRPPLVTAVFESASGSGMTGEAVLTGKTWGVSIDLNVSRLRGTGPFVCQVREADGSMEEAAVWGPTPSGNAKVTGASSIQLPNVRSVAVADKQGHVLGTARLD
ncbi:zf-HC2 domain-containing protein [Actinoplanes sp. NPDC049548]|uniref:zf-HC2 domain-containing protein n=1 Tax=Actinoplanes sp. NPDC049548 TaxID=3155152 RepID=UPI0034235B45